MRDYTITRIKPNDYLLDLYADGNWVAEKRGTKYEVEQYATRFINKSAPQPFYRSIMT